MVFTIVRLYALTGTVLSSVSIVTFYMGVAGVAVGGDSAGVAGGIGEQDALLIIMFPYLYQCSYRY